MSLRLRRALLCITLFVAGCSDSSTGPSPEGAVVIDPRLETLEIGATAQLAAQVRDPAGNLLSGRIVTWSTSNGAVVSISESGLIAAHQPGVATITATSDRWSARLQIRVPRPLPVVQLVAIDGQPYARGQTAVALEGVAVTARITVSEFAEPVHSVALLFAGGGVIAADTSHIVPGTSRELTLTSYAVPSGRHSILLQAQSAIPVTSDTAAVEVRRPISRLDIMTINGTPVEEGRRMAVADSFRIVARLVNADTAATLDRLILRRDTGEWEVISAGTSTIHVQAVSIPPGFTRHLEFTGYAAPEGSYDLVMDAEVFIRTSDGTRVTAVRPVLSSTVIPVQVSQSDRTPPVITVDAPVAGAIITDHRTTLRASFSDARGIWGFSLRVLGPRLMCASSAVFGTPVPGEIRVDRELCGFPDGPGHYRIEIWAVDAALNRAVDTLTVVYAPPHPASHGTATVSPWSSTTVGNSALRLIRPADAIRTVRAGAEHPFLLRHGKDESQELVLLGRREGVTAGYLGN